MKASLKIKSASLTVETVAPRRGNRYVVRRREVGYAVYDRETQRAKHIFVSEGLAIDQCRYLNHGVKTPPALHAGRPPRRPRNRYETRKSSDSGYDVIDRYTGKSIYLCVARVSADAHRKFLEDQHRAAKR